MDKDLIFHCPSCNAEFEYSPEWGGQKCQCCHCNHKFLVPILHAVEQPERINPPRPQRKKQAPTQNYTARKKSPMLLLGGVTILICVVIAVVFYIQSNKKVQHKKVALTLDDSADTSGKHPDTLSGESRQGSQNNYKHKIISQPKRPSGPYSGFDIKGIESIISKIEKGSEAWRREADKRIDQYRKTEIKVKVVDALSGKPVKNAEVTFQLMQHDFRFGGIINAGDFRRDEEKYKKVFLDMGFNSSGFNNSLKYKLWRGAQKKRPGEIIEWLHSNGISVRGHCLMWPGMSQGGSHIPKELLKLVEQYQKSKSIALAQKIRKCSNDIIKKWAEKWDVCEWDVINEPRGNHMIQDLLGKQIESDWFKTADKYSRNRGIKLYLNENRVISDPGKKKRIITKVKNKRVVTFKYENKVRSKNIMLFYENIKELIANGAPVNALGFQSRFHKILPPEIIYDRLCVFNEFGFPITATEFEMTDEIKSEIDKALMTERAMTVYFSHRLVDGIYAWTLFPHDNNHHILEESGRPNLRGKVWLYLTKNRWNTYVATETDSRGSTTIRGFKGKYKITVKVDGKEKVVETDFNTRSSPLTVKI